MKLIIDNVHKAFADNLVINGASYELNRGQIYALLGRNGSGKTTLFDLISNKKNLDNGSILIEENGRKRKIEQEDLFYMVANPILPNFLTGREFLTFYKDINKNRIKETRSLDELFDWIDLHESERDHLIQTYSLGTRNKLQMLMFVLIKPLIILMDEPLTSLDVVVQIQIKNMLKEMEREHIIIFSTHILQLATDLCDKIVILSDGKLFPLSIEKLDDPNVEQEIVNILSKDSKGIENKLLKGIILESGEGNV